MSSMRVPVNGCFHDDFLDPPCWWSELLPLGRRLVTHDLGPPGCREEPGEWPCTEWGPAHQLCPPLTALFTLAQLQKAADPWVLKHSDLEKQDNSWKEVSGVARPPLFSWLQAIPESLSLVGFMTKRMLTLSHRSCPCTWGLYPYGSSL